MPRSSVGQKRKAKNAGVGIDFKRARHKVGKKLPKAQNETNTTFKSKAITLPTQTVGDTKGAAVTQKNLTLKVETSLAPHDDTFCLDLGPAESARLQDALRLALAQELLGQSGHYSPKVRLEALQGLSELLAAHPEALRSQVREACKAKPSDSLGDSILQCRVPQRARLRSHAVLLTFAHSSHMSMASKLLLHPIRDS